MVRGIVALNVMPLARSRVLTEDIHTIVKKVQGNTIFRSIANVES